MTKKTARGAALAVLNRVGAGGAYANLALAEVLARSPLDARDRAFCTELVYGTLRHRARLDYLLGLLVVRPLHRLPPPVLNLLRLSAYQLEVRPDDAPYAAVDEAVDLAKSEGYPGFAGLCNAVLRGFLRRRASLLLPGPDDPLGLLTITLSHPVWLAERWLARLGQAEAADLAAADNEPAPVTLRVNTLRVSRESLLASLGEAGIKAEPAAFAPEGIRLAAGRAVESLPGFGEGHFTAQDEGAMLAGHALGAKGGEFLLDLCAAPGGKATHLAALGGDQARIVALDDHPHKVELIRKNCRRLRLTSVTAATADAREYRPDESADGVLLDTPCTGTGVLRRRPDLRWRRAPGDLRKLCVLQRELLQNAAAMVRPGGRLVYCTCSLEPEENEEQIRWFLQSFTDYSPARLEPHLPPAARALCGSDPWLHLWPHRTGTDGFFICRMEKRR
ncbi:MAG: 16S rRNA (cytosine(967)-C(5))-methyltransferase RsmB [Patescibacteria group bacterium]